MGGVLWTAVASYGQPCDAAFYLRNRQHRTAVKLARIEGPFEKVLLNGSGLPHGGDGHDAPSVMTVAGTAVWFDQGQLSRKHDAPAVVMADGSLEFWSHNQLHREHDKPAVTYANGLQAWFVHGVPHRHDAAEPHVIHPNGTREWLGTSAMTRFQLHKIDAPARVWSNGSREWYAYGKLHRLDGPAIERVDGARVWAVNGYLHRADSQPAVELADGTRAWFVNDVLHRENGPAFVFANGTEIRCIDGVPCLHAETDKLPNFADVGNFQFLREIAFEPNGDRLLEQWLRIAL